MYNLSRKERELLNDLLTYSYRLNEYLDEDEYYIMLDNLIMYKIDSISPYTAYKMLNYLQKNNILNGTLSNTWQENCPKYHCKEVFIVTDKYNEVDYSFDYSKYHEKIKNNHMFIFFAVLSSAIKEVRNNVNHANAKLTEEKIKDALDTYIVIGNKLHQSEKWRENHKNVEKRNTKRYKATIKSISKKGNVLLYVEDYKKKGDCLLDLRQSRIDINDVQKNMINKEISVKVIKEEGTNTFELFL